MELPIPYGWYAIAYSDDVKSSDVAPLNFFDAHQVLFRTEGGQAHLMDAHCPHLGAHIGHGGRVVGEHVACPFHAWEFSGTGHVKNIPYAKTMPKRATDGPCLYSYPVQERNQMIWAWFHPRRIAPLFDLEDIPEFSDPSWSKPIRYEWEFDSHIQETGENAVDIAHFVYVHRAQEMPKADITLDGYQRVTKMTTLGPAIDGEGNADLENLVETQLMTKNVGPGLTFQEFVQGFKTVMMGTIVPITTTRMKLRFDFVKPLDISEPANFLTDALIEELVRQVNNDMPIWKHKIYRPNPILCDGDGPISKYRKWFAQFYDTDESPIRVAG